MTLSKPKTTTKTINKYLLGISCWLLIHAGTTLAQTTETFETEVSGSTSFTDNGQVFNITTQIPSGKLFDIQTGFSGTGWNGTAADDRYIDNDGNGIAGGGVSFTISSSGATAFLLKKMYLYLANTSNNINVSGTLTIVGKKAGSTVFTATSSPGFNNTSLATNNGFTLIDMSAFGGSNNSNSSIDQFVITTTTSFDYVALDAMTWAAAPTPTVSTSGTLSAYTACSGTASTSKNFTVSGSSLTANLTVTAPTGFEVSTTSGSGYASSLSLTPVSGTVSSTTIYVRMASTATGSPSGNVACASSGATTVNVAVSGVVTNISVSELSKTNVSCNGGSNGAASVTLSGGTSPNTYNWTPGNPTGDGTSAVSGLTAGTWTCTVTDANGCTGNSGSITITQPTAISATTSSQTNVSCNGGSNGSATVSPSGGTSPYTYSWAPSGGTSATASSLTAGNYTCTITDANSCTKAQTVTITQPTAISATTSSQTNVSCNGGSNGSATVSPSGGTSPYTYSWAPSGGTSATASSLTAGNYTCTISDANSCTTTQTITITQPAAALTATISSQTNVNCFGANTGAASISASGGTSPYTYSWAPSGGTSATASSLTTGTYTCTITDANSCTTTQTITIMQPAAALTATISSQTNVNCFGANTGAASVSASGGTPPYTYSWAPSGGTSSAATALAAGSYTCTITDTKNCTTTQTITITQPSSALNVSVLSQSSVTCYGDKTGTASIAASGGTPTYTYSWAPIGGTTATASGLPAGTYTCTVTDMKLCTSTQTVLIAQPSSPLTVGITINGAVLTATISGGVAAQYSWVNCNGFVPLASTATYTVTNPGNYAVIIATIDGCKDTSSCENVSPVGFDQVKGDVMNWRLFPNPNDGKFVISSVVPQTMYIMNEWGVIVKIIELEEDNGFSVKIDDLSQGIYFVKTTANGIQKIIITTP